MGLTLVLNQSGESRRVGRVSLCGDGMMRTLLYEAAQCLLTRVTKWSWLKAWAMNVEDGSSEGRRRVGAATGSDHASHVEQRTSPEVTDASTGHSENAVRTRRRMTDNRLMPRTTRKM